MTYNQKSERAISQATYMDETLIDTVQSLRSQLDEMTQRLDDSLSNYRQHVFKSRKEDWHPFLEVVSYEGNIEEVKMKVETYSKQCKKDNEDLKKEKLKIKEELERLKKERIPDGKKKMKAS